MKKFWPVALLLSLLISTYYFYYALVVTGLNSIGGIIFIIAALFFFFIGFIGAWATYLSPRVKKILNNNKFERIIKIIAVSLVLLVMGIIFFSLSLS